MSRAPHHPALGPRFAGFIHRPGRTTMRTTNACFLDRDSQYCQYEVWLREHYGRREFQ